MYAVEDKEQQRFSNLQIELLKLYSTDVDEEELRDVKSYLAKYFAKKATDKADEIWDKKAFNDATMDKWLDG